jgi:endonuclease/exonuclease/phosphatase family metal-dependent hydrolase
VFHSDTRKGKVKLQNSSNQKRKRLFPFALIAAVVLVFGIQAYTAINFFDPKQPFYSGNYAVGNPKPSNVITVVSYNIWFAEEIDQAVSELKEIRVQKELDIVLLQEMDETSVDQIARSLEMNYVYFPAAIEPTYDKNFGNAILSRWAIIDAQKLVLPHQSLSNRMNRTATRAIIQVNGNDILVYSVHTESIFTLPQFRKDQYKAVLENIGPESGLVIVGGDFNSFTESAVQEIEDVYTGFSRVSQGSGASMSRYGIELPSDHIFAKGFEVVETGTMTEATASDHFPIWVTLRPE